MEGKKDTFSLKDLLENGAVAEVDGKGCILYEGLVIPIKEYFGDLAKMNLKNPDNFIWFMRSNLLKEDVNMCIENYDYIMYNKPNRKLVGYLSEFRLLAERYYFERNNDMYDKDHLDNAVKQLTEENKDEELTDLSCIVTGNRVNNGTVIL